MKFNEKLAELQNIFTDAVAPFLEGHDFFDFFDFPDYPNVGDSLIYLGSRNFFQLQGLEQRNTSSLSSPSYESSECKLAIFQGGGNLGGLYPHFDEYRLMTIDQLARDALILVMPQTIPFVDERILSEYSIRAQERNIQFFARDFETLRTFQSFGLNAKLAPDAAHMLGLMASPEPTQDFQVLQRTDAEALEKRSERSSVDWLLEPRTDRFLSAMRSLGRYSERLGRMMSLGVEGFDKLAQKRLDRGVKLLSVGETIITDRLHAMLLGLQIRRKVIAVDNNNKKLSRYIGTWGLDRCEELQVMEDFPDYK